MNGNRYPLGFPLPPGAPLPDALASNPLPIAPNLTFDAERHNAQTPEAVARSFGITLPTPSAEGDRAWNRSIQFTPVQFGPNLATRGQLGLYQDEREGEVNRSLFIQCDSVMLLQGPGVPLFATATIDSGANGISLRNIVDIVPGSIVRVPLVGQKTTVTARLFKPFPDMTTNDFFNGPPALQEGIPTHSFFMRAFVGTGVAYSSDYFAKPQRKLQNVIPGGGVFTFTAPIAAGATSVNVIGNSAFLSYVIHTADGNTFGPFPANSVQPIYLPQNSQSLTVQSSAPGAEPFEIQYYIGL